MPKLKMPTATGYLQGELQKAIDLVAFGLQCAAIANPSDLSMPEQIFQITAAGNKVMNVEDARREFRSWVLANGLRDCVEAVGPTLEWARRFCFIWTQPGKVILKADGKLQLQAEIPTEDWNSEIVDGAKAFEWMGLPNKLDHLNQRYGFPIPELAQHILSLNKARNCFSHRRGIVSQVDVNDPSSNSLEIMWRRLQFSLKNDEGERLLELPATVEGGSLLGMEFVDHKKTFVVGSSIDITPNEFVEIGMTFLFLALQIEQSCKSMEERRRSEATSNAKDA